MSNKGVFVITQARIKSTRLPSKILLDVLGIPLIVLFIERLMQMKNVDGIIIATTDDEDGRKIESIVKKYHPQVLFFFGSETNVLDRYYQAAKKYSVKHIVRITSDCPLIDPEISDLVIENYFEKKVDYCANNFPPRTYAHGLDTEVFSFASLEISWKNATKADEFEHVTPYIRKNPSLFTHFHLADSTKESFDNRWTLDYLEDFDLINQIYSHLYQKNKFFRTKDILHLLEQFPSLKKLNKIHHI